MFHNAVGAALRSFGGLGRPKANRAQVVLQFSSRNCHLEALAGPGRTGANFYYSFKSKTTICRPRPA